MTCDVIIVGAGPAGSSCANDLVRAGASVVLVDRATFPRDKCCAGWLTPQAVRALDLDLVDYGRERTVQPFRGFVTSAIGRREVRTDFGRTISVGIRRREFDDYLARRSGACLQTGVPVDSIERCRDRWRVGAVATAPCLVGAGGHFCPVARMLNPGPDRGPVVIAQDIEVRLDEGRAATFGVRPEQPTLFFCDDCRGYGWCVRKGGYLNIGFGRLRDPQFRSRFDAFRGFLHARGLLPRDLPAQWPGHAYRLRADRGRTLVGEGVLLAGDAAGLALPVSGEGILPAVESGRLAARAILDAGGHCDARHLASYVDALETRYGPARRMAGVGPLASAIASWSGVRLLGSAWFARHVLLGRWFLHQ